MRGNVHVRVRRAGTGRPTTERPQGVLSPTQHLELDRRGAELLFQVLTEREERSAIASLGPVSIVIATR